MGIWVGTMVLGTGTAMGVAHLHPMVHGSGFELGWAHQQWPASPMDHEDRSWAREQSQTQPGYQSVSPAPDQQGHGQAQEWQWCSSSCSSGQGWEVVSPGESAAWGALPEATKGSGLSLYWLWAAATNPELYCVPCPSGYLNIRVLNLCFSRRRLGLIFHDTGRSCQIGKEPYEVTFILNNMILSDYSPAVTADGSTTLNVIAVSAHMFVGCALVFSLKDS